MNLQLKENMKNGYHQFFNNARKAAAEKNGKTSIVRKHPMPAVRTKNKKKIPIKLMIFSFLGMVITGTGLVFHEEVDSYIKKIEITMNIASAEGPTAPSTAEAAAGSATASTAASGSSTNSEAISVPGSSVAATNNATEDSNHFANLNERKKELDLRESEISQSEKELISQKEELEKRIKELEQMREKISSILEERVKSDKEKVDNLVQMYSNMKAPQAAKVFENLDEDLAIEILGKMKKKNAADIMNLLKPDKAQILSEKYAGYKRK